jgi:hypothetical protein
MPAEILDLSRHQRPHPHATRAGARVAVPFFGNTFPSERLIGGALLWMRSTFGIRECVTPKDLRKRAAQLLQQAKVETDPLLHRAMIELATAFLAKVRELETHKRSN